MNLFKISAFFLAVLIVLVSMAWTMDENYRDEGKSSIQITSEGNAFAIETVQIQYIRDYLGEFDKKILIKVQSVHRSKTNTESQQSHTLIEARSVKDFFATPLWTATDTGNEVAYLNEELIASQTFGCCGDFDRSKIYHIETGKNPATFIDGDFFTISVPNSEFGKRYFVNLDDKDAPSHKNGHNYIGSIGYFDIQGKMTKVRLYVKLSPGWSTTLSDLSLVNLGGKKSKNVLQGRDLELWDQEGASSSQGAFKNFALSGKIKFENKTLNFNIAVNGDQIEASGVKTSPGLVFEVIH